ncbi:hypothetical protein [Ahniella affigens]|nr:hypothetical protein [Ahniella affigens]
MILMIVGIGLALVGGLWLLVKAFQTSILWGLGCLFLAPVQLVFIIMHWDVAKKPFLYYLAGIVIMVIGTVLGAPALENIQPT